MSKDEFLPIIQVLKQNNIHYEIIPKYIKLSLKIPSLNICIEKYYLGTYYYIYLNNQFIKKMNKENFVMKLSLIKN